MKLDSLLKSKYILYIVLFFSICNILGLVAAEDFNSLGFFITLALLTAYFTKNMIVVLGTAMAGTNFLIAQNIIEGFKEGADPADEDSLKNIDVDTTDTDATDTNTTNTNAIPNTDDPDTNNDDSTDEPADPINVPDPVTSLLAGAEGEGAAATGGKCTAEQKALDACMDTETFIGGRRGFREGFSIKKSGPKGCARYNTESLCKGSKGKCSWDKTNTVCQVAVVTGKMHEDSIRSTAAASGQYYKQAGKCMAGTCPEGAHCYTDDACTKKRDGFGQRNVPPSRPRRLEDDDDEDIGKRIDYATTLEQAYDNLQNMLGKGGMKGLANETKHLVDQQKDLMKSLSNMTPVLQNAKDSLKGMNLPDISQLKGLLTSLKGK